MHDDLELALPTTTPSGVVAALKRVPGVQVRENDIRSYLRHAARTWELRPLPRSAVDDPHQLELLAGHGRKEDQSQTLLFVAATSLPRSLRRELAARQISYADARGHVHLRASGLFVYVDVRVGSPGAPPSGRSSGIGLVGIRVAQALATTSSRTWTVTDLASEANVSVGEAHKILARLEREGLIEALGRGPAKRRRVRDPGNLLDWLATQPQARRVYRHLPCSLYARTPIDLARRVSHSLDATKTAHAFTSGLAATLLHSGPTSVPRAVLRVDPDWSLEEIADALDAKVTERGANLTLWSDDGLVGTHRRIRHEDTWLAPPVRVYVDLLSERRGADVAAHFREVVLGS